MSIVTLLEQLASTVHHKINLDLLLKDEPSTIQKHSFITMLHILKII